MNRMLLRPSTEVAATVWLGPRLRSFGSAVAAVVPDGFLSYVRILHPAQGKNGEPVRWSSVAARTGRIMHRLAQFHAIARPLVSAEPDSTPWEGVSPQGGNLPPELLRVLCRTLRKHTTTANSCWFCLWEGYGWLRGSSTATIIASSDGILKLPRAGPDFASEMLHQARVSLPNRDYLLFEGPLEAATELGERIGDAFFPQSPNLFWPQDHAWCVASEIDLFCTLIAGSDSLAEDLVNNPMLEAWRVEPGDSIAFDSDQINS